MNIDKLENNRGWGLAVRDGRGDILMAAGALPHIHLELQEAKENLVALRMGS
jgi:hypothetical protein